MPRQTKIEELGIGEQVHLAFKRLGDYTEVSRELIREGYDVSMQQVRNYLDKFVDVSEAVVKRESDGDFEFPIADDEPSIIPYQMASSIFDVLIIADNNYKYLGSRLNKLVVSTKISVSVIAEIRKNAEFAANTLAKAAEIEEQLAFQQEVINAISEVEPNVAKKILDNLRSRNALRQSLIKPRDGSY